MKWIVTRHMSSLDGTAITMAEGSVDAIKKHLVRMVKTDQALEETENGGTWVFGTENPEDVQVDKCGLHTLYAFGSYEDIHIDYTAKPLDWLTTINCEED